MLTLFQWGVDNISLWLLTCKGWKGLVERSRKIRAEQSAVRSLMSVGFCTWEGATLDIHTDCRMGCWRAVPLKGTGGPGQQQIERESAVCPGSQEGQPFPAVH